MNLRRAVITGIGTINPIGNNVSEYFENLKKGVSGAGDITRFDATKFKTRFACEVKGYNWADHFDRKEVRKYDLYTQYALVAVKEAINDSKLDLEKIDLDRSGVIWASGIGGIISFQEEIAGFVSGGHEPRFNPFFIPKMIADIAAGHISMQYNFRGPNYATVSACASANHALNDAVMQIQLGKADIIISGGSEAAVIEAGVGGFSAMKALSSRNDNPKIASRPFDVDRDGFVLGEGAGALIVEEYEHAIARGAKIYAEIVGCGMSADAYHLTAPHPEGDGAKRSMLAAIKDAGLTIEDIEYVNTHGTSTPVGDVAEIKGVMATFGEHAYKLNIGATKSMTGHLLGAAGAVEALACIMALNEGIIPPTINCDNVDPQIDSKLNLTLGVAQKRNITYALSNTFGFGGHNSTVIFKKL